MDVHNSISKAVASVLLLVPVLLISSQSLAGYAPGIACPPFDHSTSAAHPYVYVCIKAAHAAFYNTEMSQCPANSHLANNAEGCEYYTWKWWPLKLWQQHGSIGMRVMAGLRGNCVANCCNARAGQCLSNFKGGYCSGTPWVSKQIKECLKRYAGT